MDQETDTGKTAPGNTDGDNRHVQAVIQQAELELRGLLKERAKVTKRIGSLKQTINGLAEIFGDGILSAALLDLVDPKINSRQSGITPACRRILMEARRPMSARGLCDEIQRTMPALLAHHKDPVATVYTILGRLVSYGEATGLSGDRGKRAWLWAAESENSSLAPDTGSVWQQAPGSVIPSGI
jgi:hypothetical protein